MMKDRAYIELINEAGRALPQDKKAAAAELFEKHLEKYQSYEELYWTIWKMKQREKDIVDNAGLFLCQSMNIEVKELIASNKDELNINGVYDLFEKIYCLYFEMCEDGKQFEKKFNQAFTDDVMLTIYKTYLEQYVGLSFKYTQIVEQMNKKSQLEKIKISVSEEARKLGF